MSNFDNIYKLLPFTFLDWEWEFLALSNVPNYSVMEQLVKEFRKKVWYDIKEWYEDEYNFEELENFLNEKGYFFYIPKSDIIIDF